MEYCELSKKILRRQFRWIPMEMLFPILDKNLPVENEISQS